MKIVIVGASNNPDKYGNKILKDLVSKGHNVIPINPKEDFIEGIKVYKNIFEIKENFDVINFVVPPKITLKVLENNIFLLKNKKVWCQPGSSDDEVKTFLEVNKFSDYITDNCIMIQNIKKGSL